jgi:hypothetical protein
LISTGFSPMSRKFVRKARTQVDSPIWGRARAR